MEQSMGETIPLLLTSTNTTPVSTSKRFGGILISSFDHFHLFPSNADSVNISQLSSLYCEHLAFLRNDHSLNSCDTHARMSDKYKGKGIRKDLWNWTRRLHLARKF